MLFDTPGVTVPDSVMAPPTNGPTKRKRKVSDDAPAPPSPAVNLDKLMKQMQKLEKDSGWKGDVGAGGKTGAKAAEKGAPSKRNKPNKTKKAAGPPPTSGGNTAALGQVDVPAPAPSPAPAKLDEGHRGPPPRAAPRPQSRAPPAPAHPGSSATAAVAAPAAKAPGAAAWKPAQKEKANKNRERAEAARAEAALEVANEPKKVVRHSAPTTEAGGDDEAAPVIAQTAMQKSLRAKLAGGKFRMLNEALYTSTGEQAWAAMKEDGAFDDYHAGFRSQAAHWPTQPLTLLTTSLSAREPGTFVADFGCGDAALARALVPQGLNVISFDLVSKDGWVIEAECSSVPLPGGTSGSEIVDVVVCCLSLMGTDWIQIVREAKRVLKDGGELRIAEVSSRFTDVDAFVALITGVGFKLDAKDDSNTHFMMFDFTKTGETEDRKHKAEATKKAPGLLKACIYKKR